MIEWRFETATQQVRHRGRNSYSLSLFVVVDVDEIRWRVRLVVVVVVVDSLACEFAEHLDQPDDERLGPRREIRSRQASDIAHIDNGSALHRGASRYREELGLVGLRRLSNPLCDVERHRHRSIVELVRQPSVTTRQLL